MNLIWKHSSGSGQARHAIVVFGSGLIGRSIVQAVIRQGYEFSKTLPFSWTEAKARSEQASQLKQRILAGRATQFDVIWAAGKAGFGAGPAELESEMLAFLDVVRLSEDLVEEAPSTKHYFHLMSSAGGLFEGQRFVTAATLAAPLRPYGFAKLEQEVRCRAIRTEIVTSIYRPSSVYGFSGTKGRAGLITVLCNNAWQHRPSRIFGTAATVRDYVLVHDIGQFVAQRLIAPSRRSQTLLLASGKPSAMHEVLSLLAKVVGRRLYVSFDPNPSNADHMSFAPEALPDRWQTTDLETGMRQTVRDLLTSFSIGSPN